MAIDVTTLKSRGFLKQTQDGRYSLRLKVVGGNVTAEQLESMRRISEKYGNGYIHLTSRQSVEIPFVKLEEIEKVLDALAEEKLSPASTGPRVRTITACQGSAVCANGLIDTSALAREFDARFGGRMLPHKFKIGLTGCRNNCLKAEENDLGVKGCMEPKWNAAACIYCGKCAKVCPTAAIGVDPGKKKLTYEQDKCVKCGKCVKACPTKAWTGESGFIVYFGGLFGKRIAIGRPLLPVIHSEETLYAVVEAALKFFEENAEKGERFSTLLDRVGWDKLQKRLEEAAAVK